MMNRSFRTFMYAVAFSQLILAVAFILQLPFVTQIWPFPETTPLTFIFIGSIFAAAAASTLWCLFTKTDGALAGVALDYITIFIPVSVLAFQIGIETGNSSLLLFGVVCVFSLLFGGYLLKNTRNLPIPSVPPMPRLVKWSFIVFIIALIIVGGALILKTPNVLPWSVTPELSVVAGWMFVGAAAYFIFALLRPSWGNSGGQLAGFLAYDVVLIIPFLQRLPTVPPQFQVGLYIYTAVVSYSGLLSIYYLFINRDTRITTTRREN